jgi:hypothetical protein
MVDCCDFIAVALSEFWHALAAEKNTVIASLATIFAAIIGALVVIYQIGRQARNAIEQNRSNEALKLKLEVYKDIIRISREASNAITDLSSFIRQFHVTLSLARQTQAELNAYAVPSAHPSQLIERKSQLYSSHIKVMAITETWQMIDPRIDIFRKAISTSLFDIDTVYSPYFNAAIRAMPLGVSKDPAKEGSSISWVPPSIEVLQQIGTLGTGVIDTLMTLQSYVFDFQREMQILLLGEMFRHTIPPRVPVDAKSVVIQLDRHDELSRYFDEQTGWGREQTSIKNAMNPPLH